MMSFTHTHTHTSGRPRENLLDKSVADQFAVKYKSATYCWRKKLNRENYEVDKYFLLL
jgi:hypothetical protein